MADLQWLLELLLVGLLLATLFHALRLERALGVLKRDRAALEALVSGFNGATRQAEQGIDRLRDTADGAGRQISRQIESVTALKEDLIFLIERGDRLADRLDGLVRNGRTVEAAAPAVSPAVSLAMAEDVPVPAQFSGAQFSGAQFSAAPSFAPAAFGVREAEAPAEAGGPRVRSQAERDLLRALRMAR